MKLSGELKEKVEQTKSAAEAKEVLESAGIELTDNEVEEVAGGIYQPKHKTTTNSNAHIK